MSERKLEPTPGWCERAMYLLRRSSVPDILTYNSLYDEYHAVNPPSLQKPSDPKPAPLPHEWQKVAEGIIWPLWQCVYCWKTDRCDDPPRTACPKRNLSQPAEKPQAAIIGAYDKRLEEQELERQSKKIFDALTKPAEKAEAPPRFHVVSHDADPRVQEFATKLNADYQEREREFCGKLENLAEEKIRRMIRDELSKARIENRYLGGEWTRATLLRIVPGKEGE